MQLHRLRYFVAVARYGSLTRAAERLSLAQPSLSEQIHKLERELGTPLFDRLGRGLVLTAAGEAFRLHAERALYEVEEGRQRVNDVLGLRRGRVAVGVLPSVGATLLPSVLAEFGRNHPDVEVRLIEENVSARFEDMVHAGQLDMATIRFPRQRQDLDGALLVREPIVALLPPGHPLAARTAIAVAALREEPFVALKSGYGLRDLMVPIFQRAGFEPRVVVETGQLEIARALVSAGIGVTLLPRMAAGGAPVQVPVRDPLAVRELGVVWRAATPLSPAATAFLELLRRAAAAW